MNEPIDLSESLNFHLFFSVEKFGHMVVSFPIKVLLMI